MKPALHFPVIVAGKSKRRFQISLWPFPSRNGSGWNFDVKLKRMDFNWPYAFKISPCSKSSMKRIITALDFNWRAKVLLQFAIN